MSTSSSSTTGFIEPASLMARTMRPGSAPTYVRRWPRISASSRTPPSATRTNLRPSARATDSPSEVLPTPGGPASSDDRAGAPAADDLQAALGAAGADREVLHDPLLDLVEAVVVGVEHGPGGEHVVDVLGGDPHGSSRTVSSQVRIQAASGFCSLERSSLSTSFSAAARTCSGRSAASTRPR